MPGASWVRVGMQLDVPHFAAANAQASDPGINTEYLTSLAPIQPRVYSVSDHLWGYAGGIHSFLLSLITFNRTTTPSSYRNP